MRHAKVGADPLDETGFVSTLVPQPVIDCGGMNASRIGGGREQKQSEAVWAAGNRHAERLGPPLSQLLKVHLEAR